MEPNKFELQFKEKLNSREIQPSEMTWNKLDAMLTDAEKPKAKFPRMYVAASFVGFLLLGTFYFNQKGNTMNNSKVVLETSVAPPTTVGPDKRLKAAKEQEKGLVFTVVPKSISRTNGAPILKVKSTSNGSMRNQEVALLIKNHSQEDTTIGAIATNANDELPPKSKYISAEQLLAQVSNTKSKTSLAAVAIEKTRKGVEVNANRLLSEAETELNQSFRASALDRLNKNFNTIKTVLVNRNYTE
ncbi:hypothetical protein SAMN05444395_103194 [Flavobacterium fryxellicola]|uniref:Uncharacterized protein n=1 Tax=Flavobacterium fryxellicola TaxID=249352 RepID=A0A167X390_9FLAO|nr:hypothetical protein [Flavobacterium fryxellicola]OAB27988.1 hypothetical protein FBFR_09030 [Flavobacterium fryxellicola]SHN65094.1 hypothetical protein SAMN05444395_103194 [Flavobacterium fryxellicola]